MRLRRIRTSTRAAHHTRTKPRTLPHVHRGLKEIREIIARAPISAGAQAFALKAFELLAQAEGKIHNRPAESIHFHEVGSEDAIVDIVCAAVAVEAIAADRWYCSALNVGSGTVRCAHGVLPVPAPATAELLRGAPVYSSGIPRSCSPQPARPSCAPSTSASSRFPASRSPPPVTAPEPAISPARPTSSASSSANPSPRGPHLRQPHRRKCGE